MAARDLSVHLVSNDRVRVPCSALTRTLAGGNAGLAAAFCAQQLGIPITVVVPESTPALTICKLKEEGAVVEVKGKVRLESCVK